ncbi:MAG TPA: hypothetical protein VGI91_06910 [Steroidobacteraceae bacterium]|jgi:hypothetical protein
MAIEDKALGTVGYALMPILRLAQQLPPGGSLTEALQQLGYAKSRASFAAADVRALVSAHPALLDAWLAYSQGKQTADGWYVLPDAEVGQLSRPSSQRHFASIEEAVSEFILRELDHHAALAAPTRGGTPPSSS